MQLHTGPTPSGGYFFFLSSGLSCLAGSFFESDIFLSAGALFFLGADSFALGSAFFFSVTFGLVSFASFFGDRKKLYLLEQNSNHFFFFVFLETKENIGKLIIMI